MKSTIPISLLTMAAVISLGVFFGLSSEGKEFGDVSLGASTAEGPTSIDRTGALVVPLERSEERLLFAPPTTDPVQTGSGVSEHLPIEPEPIGSNLVGDQPVKLPAGKYVDDPGRQVLSDGFLYIYHGETENLAEVGPWVNGAREGIWDSFSEDGGLILSGFYSKGVAVGRWDSWYDNGRQSARVHISKGQLEGACTFWHSTGGVDAERTGSYRAGVKEE